MKIIPRIKYLLSVTIIGCAMGLGLNSCSFLNVDKYFYDMTNLDSVFTRKSLLQSYIYGAAAMLPNESKLYTASYAPYQTASDENFTSWNDDRHAGMKLYRDEITPFSTYFNNWPANYKIIRKANLILARINECKDLSDMDKRDFVGEAYFLRGYAYYQLIQQYGPVPIVPETAFDVGDNTDNLTKERNTYDECVSYICSDMDKAAEYLADSRESSTFYIPTKWAALAVISRIRLYDASPLFNGGTGSNYFNDWKTSTGKNFISQVNDNNKWGVAAVASKVLIDANKFTLNTVAKDPGFYLSTATNAYKLPSNVSSSDFPDGAGNIDPYHSYADMFNGEISPLSNPEFIYSCVAISGSDSPGWIALPGQLGGGNGLNITQRLVDAYKMVDGRDINNSSATYPYPTPTTSFVASGISFEYFPGYTIKASVANMYMRREPRFYASIAFCEYFLPGTSYTGTDASLKNMTVTYYYDGTAAALYNYPDDHNWSGYTLKKYLHPEDNLKGTMRSKTFPIFRYAETLLNYVEAINELNGSYTDTITGMTVSRNVADIKKYFNQIRYRAGLPGLTDDEAADQATMRDLIKRERMVEFACEGRRYHDLRRWGEASKFGDPLYGCNINAKTLNRQLFYTATPLGNATKLAQRTFTHKMYFYPIPQSVFNKNNKLVQNPGW